MITIRNAEEKDLLEILDIYNYAILNTTSVYSYEPHTLEMRRQWFEDKKAHNHPVFVAIENDRVVGFIAYGPFRAWPAYKHTMEHSVHVHINHRRKGVARLLLQQLIETAKTNNVHVLIGAIDASNDASIILHEQLGFEETGHLKEVGYKFNRWLDLKFYQLTITTKTS
jgi:L-amino acid N-acyltransferase